MRQLLSNISANSIIIANQGIELIVRAEAAGSRVAESLSALIYGALHLMHEMRGTLGLGPAFTWDSMSRVPAVRGSVVAKRRSWQHFDTCCHPAS